MVRQGAGRILTLFKNAKPRESYDAQTLLDHTLLQSSSTTQPPHYFDSAPPSKKGLAGS
ncbi:MAG: hypothetical protein AAFP93_01900 [Bacteroidota bacterium]